MSVLRTRVIGPVVLPDGSDAPDGAKVIFTLQGWDKTNDSVILGGPVEAVVAFGGIDVDLHRTTTGDKQTAYRVDYTYFNDASRRWETGRLSDGIQLTGAGPVELADLLAVPAAEPTLPDALAQALAAAASAEADALTASNDRDAADAALAATLDAANDVATIAAGAAIWEDTTAYGADVLRADGWAEAHDLIALGAVTEQISVVAAGYVVDAEDYGKVITSLAAAAPVDARALEIGREYLFRVYPNSAYGMKIDFGEGAIINGFLTFRGIELLAGQSVRVAKITDTVIYVHDGFAPSFRDHGAVDSFQEPMGNGEWRYWRRVTVNAGATANVSLPGQYAGFSVAPNPRVTIVTIGATATEQAVVRSISDAAIQLYNPNASAVAVEYMIEGLRTYPTSLAAHGDHFRSQFAPLEPTRDLERDYTVISTGQSLADAYANRACYKGLDAALRSAGLLTAGHYLDLVNTAVGGSLIDKQTLPAHPDYWYDTGTNTNGPLLTAALAKIAAAYTAGKTPQAIIYDHGQTESLYLGSTASRTAVTAAMNAIINALAAAAPGVPIYLQTLIGRENVAANGSQIMREIQLNVAATNGNVDGFIDHYDSKLIDGTHPLNAGYRRAGDRMGKMIGAAYAPPAITAAVLAAGKVTLTVGALNLAMTPVNSTFDFSGVKTSTGYIRARGTVKSATSIELVAHPLSGAANLTGATHVCWPLSDYALDHGGAFPANAAGLLVKSALFVI